MKFAPISDERPRSNSNDILKTLGSGQHEMSARQLNGGIQQSNRAVQRQFYQRPGAIVRSVLSLNPVNGNGPMTSPDHTAHATAKPLTKLSETSYSNLVSAPLVRLG